MFYRENGQYKTSYRADQQMLPILQDRIFMGALLVFAYGVMPFVVSDYLLLSIVVPFLILTIAVIGLNPLVAKNLVRGHIGRAWMAMRDMDVAAEVIGIRPIYAKLTAFAVSSFYCGVAGALWGFVHLGSWEPLAFNINLSFNLLFMIIIG